jgi:hypothetical protein
MCKSLLRLSAETTIGALSEEPQATPVFFALRWKRFGGGRALQGVVSFAGTELVLITSNFATSEHTGLLFKLSMVCQGLLRRARRDVLVSNRLILKLLELMDLVGNHSWGLVLS